VETDKDKAKDNGTKSKDAKTNGYAKANGN